MGTIAHGILTIIAFKHDCDIWKRYPGWLRTLRVQIPTVSIVKEAFAWDFHALLCQFSHLPVAQNIIPLLRSSEFLYINLDRESFDLSA